MASARIQPASRCQTSHQTAKQAETHCHDRGQPSRLQIERPADPSDSLCSLRFRKLLKLRPAVTNVGVPRRSYAEVQLALRLGLVSSRSPRASRENLVGLCHAAACSSSITSQVSGSQSPAWQAWLLARLSRAPERSVLEYVSTGAQRKRSQKPRSPGVLAGCDELSAAA